MNTFQNIPNRINVHFDSKMAKDRLSKDKSKKVTFNLPSSSKES